MLEKYTFTNLLKAVDNPTLFLREIGGPLDRALRPVASSVFEHRHGSGIDMMSYDWDTLILLDACRYDVFASEIDPPGEVKPVISPGAHSWEFMKNTFVGRTFHDTIYVTANPHAVKLTDDIFFKLEILVDHWDEDLGTVHPQTVFDRAKCAHEAYPDKRLVVHFMQPHRPYLGKTADCVRSEYDLRGFNHRITDDRDSRTGSTWWTLVKTGDVSLELTKEAYTETLEIAFEYVEALLAEVDGKTVISSDHGEMLGERGVLLRRFGHPHDVYTSEGRVVPWCVMSNGQRREVMAETPIEAERPDGAIVDERLQALGYKPRE